jgi:hypothetical protein
MRFKPALPFLLLLLASCASLPLPNTPEKSLLIIPCNFSLGTNHDGPRLVGITISMTPTNVASGAKVTTLSVPLGTEWVAFAVDPGSYVFSTAIVAHGWYDRGGVLRGSWQDTVSVGNGLYVQQQTILLYQSVLSYADRADPNSGWDFAFYQSVVGTERGAKILAALKKDRHWSGWEGYQLVNFPKE